MRSEHSYSCPLDLEQGDLEYCYALVGEETWASLSNCRLLLTGGTGFIGKWMLASLIYANQRQRLGCDILVLSRNLERFLAEWPELCKFVIMIPGNVRSIDLPDHDLDIIIHAATDVETASSPDDIFATCSEGTARIVELVRKCSAKRLLLLSSGAIYGALPHSITHVPETYLGAPDPLLYSSAYAEGKRVSEWLASRAASYSVHVAIARIFALVGPHLPLDAHFAIGNFIGNALRGEDIEITGDGTPHRSYLYAADMAAWLWLILLKGKSCIAYNVGSEESLSILQVAELVRDVVNPGVRVKIKEYSSFTAMPSNYVPATARIRHALQLPDPICTRDAISRTSAWFRKRSPEYRSERIVGLKR
jgi:nucleoside-diphosphate-sugar epimerase